ncbi:MAG: tetratricopeptide repeat protein [Myxococcaceae bacterium]
MRIVCEKCSAAYAIDDKFITPKGIRAQCPRCRHLQLVKRDDSAIATAQVPVPAAPPPAAPPPAAAPLTFGGGFGSGAPIEAIPTKPRQASPFLFDLEVTKPGGPPPGAGGSMSALNAVPAKPSSVAIPPPPPPMSPQPPGNTGSELDFSELNFEAVPPTEQAPAIAAPPPPAAAKAARPSSLPPQSKIFSAPGQPRTSPPVKPPVAAAPQPSVELNAFSFDDLAPPPPSKPPPAAPAKPQAPLQPDPFDLAIAAGAPKEPLGGSVPATSEVAAVVKCKSCGKPLTDPFDQAIGTCDDCRNTSTPLTDEDKSLRTNPGLGAIAPSPAAPTVPAMAKIEAAAAATAEPELEVESSKAPAPAATNSIVRKSRVSAMRDDLGDDEGPSKGKLIAGVAVVLVLAAGAAYVGITKPWSKKAPPLVVKQTGGEARPVDKIIEAWKLRYLDELSGSSADHLAAGEEQLAKDTTSGYRDAEEEFQKALVLDKGNDRAIAGWVLALAFGRGLQLDDATYQDAVSLVSVAEQRVPGCGRACTAHAHLLLARGANLNDVQALAERGKSSPSQGDRALALLALGESLLSRNPQFAAQDFDEALKLDPKLKRAYLARSKLLLSQGRYREAVDSLQKRLELDPEQWESSYELGKVYVAVGDVAAAKKVYAKAREVDPKNFRARLALAVLAYQHENNLKDALAQLDAMAAEEDKIEKRQLVEILGHRAAAERLTGELDAANGSIDKALAAVPDDVNANLQRFAIAVRANKGPDARAVWPKLQGKLGDEALELTLEGRLLFAEGTLNDALKKFQAAVNKDHRRTDAMLLAAATAAKLKIDVVAYDYAIKQGSKADPMSTAPVQPMARYFIRPNDLLSGMADAFAPLQKDAEDPNVPMARGLILWHSGDAAGAEKMFDQVIATDPANALGLAFRSISSLKKNDLASAARFGSKAAENGKQVGLAHVAYGMALFATNQLDAAKKELRTGSDLEPAMLAPRVKLGEIEARQKHLDEARKILATVLLQDPMYHDAERALFAMP